MGESFEIIFIQITKFEQRVRQFVFEKLNAELSHKIDCVISDQARERGQIISQEREELKPLTEHFSELQSRFGHKKYTREEIKQRIREREERFKRAKQTN